MKKKNKKVSPVTDVPMEYKPESNLRLEGKEAAATAKMPIGSKKTMMITVEKREHRMDNMGHTAHFKVTKASPKKQFNIYKKG